MNRRSKLFTLSGIMCAVLMTGCATIQETSQKVGNAVGISDTKTASAAGGAALGCAGGAVVGYVTGVGAGKGCLAGGAVVGGLSLYQAYENELAEAKRMEEESRMREQAARARGVEAPVVRVTQRVENVKETDKVTGKEEVKKVSKLDKMTLDLTTQGVRDQTEDTVAVVDKATALATRSPRPVEVTVKGSKAERAWLKQRVEANSKGSKVTVREVAAAKPALILSPIPQ